MKEYQSAEHQNKLRNSSLIQVLITLGAISLFACNPGESGSSNRPNNPIDDSPGAIANKPIYKDGIQTLEPGQDEFLSASGERGENATDLSENGSDAAAPESELRGESAGDDRTVEEGDIYRVISQGLMANLNHYRGLQLIDISEPSEPQILSRLSLSGSPVEMYFIDGYAVVLMNNWWGYWGSRDDIEVETFNGGLAALIDIRDTANPVLVSTQPVPGYITTSRLTRGMGGDALFVVANDWTNNENRTVLRSFSVETSGALGLNPASELDLGGYVSDIQATPSTLLIARQQGWWRSNGQDDWEGTYVSLVDISDPSGLVVEGASVRVSGYVRRKNDMHIKNGILRIVSNDWSQGSVVATWNIDDLQNPISVDQARFGEGEDLYASLFMADRAFFVTYQRVDPFHAFSIDSEGLIEERTEYIISGWNDFFRPTFNQSRLIGIGMDDQIEGQTGQSIAVSLYSTSLEESEPFIARAHGDLTGWSWSEARWDDRAFSVIEDAVSVDSPEGHVETGLVLLPFSGYDRNVDEGWGRWRSGVQIFTFSDQSVTARGVMSHNSPVRRSFEPQEGMVGNLSELSLSLYDRSNPDEPSLLGQIDLAPEISRIYFIGEGPARHPVRFKGSNDLFYGWYDNMQDMAPAVLEVLPVGANVDLAAPIATVEVPAHADLRQKGDTIYVIYSRNFYEYDEDGDWQIRKVVELSVVDLSNPHEPIAHDPVDVSEIMQGYDHYYDYYYDGWGCFDMGYYWWGRPELEVHTIEGGLAIKTLELHEESLGEYEVCRVSGHTNEVDLVDVYTDDLPICDEIDWEMSNGVNCQAIYGVSSCGRFENSEFSCQGELRRCVVSTDDLGRRSQENCETLEGLNYATLATNLSRRGQCYSYERTRRWGSLRLSVIDTQDPDHLQLSGTIEAPSHERFEGLILQEGELYYSYSVPVNVDGDEISFVRHFTRSINLEDLSTPSFNTAINLPGKLLLKRGERVISRDLVWGENGVISTLNLTRLNEEGTRARFEARHSFTERQIQKIIYDQDEQGDERLYISHSPNYNYWDYWARQDLDNVSPDEDPRLNRISVFELSELSLLGEAASDRWSNLITVKDHRGIFNVGGGILMMDLSDPTQITAQGFFPIQGWNPMLTIEGDDIYAAAGRYGVYTLPLNRSNLLPPL